MRKIKYVITNNQGYSDVPCEDLEDDKRTLDKILHDNANHNYFANKNNSYYIERQTIEYEDDEDDGEVIDSFGVNNEISVRDYDKMSCNEREELINSISDNYLEK